MHSHYKRVMLLPVLNGALPQQPFFIAPGNIQFRKPLKDKKRNEDDEVHFFESESPVSPEVGKIF